MVLYQDDPRQDPTVSHARLAVLEALEPAHKLHCYSDVDALAVTLDATLAQLRQLRKRGKDVPAGLTRVCLVFTDPRAVQVISMRMEPGYGFPAWPAPDAWLQLYARIDDLRARARQFNPQFTPRYL